MRSAVRGAAVLAVALLIPACRITFTSDDPFAPSPAPQNPFVLQVPLDGATGVMTTNTQFSWSALPGAQSYQLQISRTSDFAVVLYDQPNIAVTWVYVNTALTNSTSYYWRITGHGAGAPQIAGGSPYRFTTIFPQIVNPGSFFLQAPLGGPASRTPVFQWTAATNTSSYRLEVDTSILFTTPVFILPAVHFNQATSPVTLAPQTTYHWRVTAQNGFGTTFPSPPSATFTTGP